MSAAGPPQGARPLGGAARSAGRGDPPTAAGPPQGARPLGGAARSAGRGDPPTAAGPPQGDRPLGGAARSAGRGDPPSAAPSAKFPLFFHALHAVERVFVRCSVHGEAEIHRNEDFPWVRALESAWPAIRAELDAVMQRDEPIPPFQAISPEQAALTQDEQWRTYVLYAYGAQAARNCRECPATAAAVERIPGMKSALFSILSPGKHIPPHRGPYKGMLRCHLGLRIPGPPGAARLRVGATQATWAEGRALIFDDTLEHEVWNDSTDVRAVLFIDFLRPMRPPMDWINATVVKLIVGSPFGQANIRRFRAWYRARGIDADV